MHLSFTFVLDLHGGINVLEGRLFIRNNKFCRLDCQMKERENLRFVQRALFSSVWLKHNARASCVIRTGGIQYPFINFEPICYTTIWIILNEFLTLWIEFSWTVYWFRNCVTIKKRLCQIFNNPLGISAEYITVIIGKGTLKAAAVCLSTFFLTCLTSFYLIINVISSGNISKMKKHCSEYSDLIRMFQLEWKPPYILLFLGIQFEIMMK